MLCCRGLASFRYFRSRCGWWFCGQEGLLVAVSVKANPNRPLTEDCCSWYHDMATVQCMDAIFHRSCPAWLHQSVSSSASPSHLPLLLLAVSRSILIEEDGLNVLLLSPQPLLCLIFNSAEIWGSKFKYYLRFWEANQLQLLLKT